MRSRRFLCGRVSVVLAAAVLAAAVLAAASCSQPAGPARRTVLPVVRGVYVLESMAETLSLLDLDSGVLHRDVLPVGKWPNDVVRFRDELWVVDSGDNALRIIREVDWEPIATIRLGKNRNPWALAIDPARGEGWVTNFVAGTVSVVDLGRRAVVAEVPVGRGPEGCCVLGGRVFVANTAYDAGTDRFGEGTVSVIDVATRRVEATISVEAESWTAAEDGGNPQSLIAFPDRNEVHVVLTGVNGGPRGDDGEVVVLDAATLAVKARLPVGGSPLVSRNSVDQASGRVFLAGLDGIATYALEPLSVERPSKEPLLALPGSFASAAAFVPAGGARAAVLLAADFNGDRVLGVDPATGAVLWALRSSDGPVAFCAFF